MLAPVLSIQSHVVFGHVGNSAAVFPLQRLGREVWPLMTVQFSSHTGYPGWRGRAFDAGLIDECVAGLEAIGVLSRCAGLLTGYIGKPEIGEAALRALAAIRASNTEAVYACDPVIGDTGRGSYVAAGVGEFFRDRALPLATIATPNAFELEWLTGKRAADLDAARRAIAALRERGPQVVVAKSLTLDDTPADALDMLAGDETGFWRLRTPKLPIAVNGAGDVFAALFLHHWLETGATPAALSRAAASVYAVVTATEAAGSRELALIAAQDELVRPSRLFAAEPV
jgi:pyridoxine kinase